MGQTCCAKQDVSDHCGEVERPSNWSCCCASSDDHGEEVEHIRSDGKKATLSSKQKHHMKPLLVDLEHDFREFANSEGKLSASELVQVWKKCAARKVGHLSKRDESIIERSAKLFIDVLDLDHSGFVSYEELAVFMLGGCEERGPLKDMRAKLKKAVEMEPDKLKEVIRRFRLWDKSGTGYVTLDDLQGHFGELAELTGKDPSEGESMARQLFHEADFDDDGKIELWDVVAHSLGRRKTPVELLLYDISSGISKHFSKLLVGTQVEAVYHSSVLAFGKEYWFGGKVFRSNPPCASFGKPLKTSMLNLKPSYYNKELMTVHLGYTLVNMKEWHEHVVNELAKSYTPATYDVLSHNCNDFSNACVHFLTGGHIPDEVMNLPELVMHSKQSSMLLRPFMNHWLGGFGGDGLAGFHDDTDHGNGATEANTEEIVKKLTLGVDRVVIVPHGGEGGENVVAAITDVYDEDHCEIRYFDPESCEFVTKQVHRDDVERTKSDHMRLLRHLPTWGRDRQMTINLGTDSMDSDSISRTISGISSRNLGCSPHSSPKSSSRKKEVRLRMPEDGADEDDAFCIRPVSSIVESTAAAEGKS